MIQRMTTIIRVLLGVVYLVNGVNWFFKIITPYPSMSDFVNYLPPHDIVGALIETGIMFHLAKGIEVLGGICLLTNRMVPLALVVSMTVTTMVFITDVFRPEWRLRAFLMGSGSFILNVYLLLAYYDHYRTMLSFRAHPNPDPSRATPVSGGVVADALARIGRPAMLVLGPIGVVQGLVMVIWLAVMIGQYAADPKPIYAVHPLTSRPSIPH